MLAILGGLAILVAVLWPWVSPWLPEQPRVQAWIRFLVVDLEIRHWGPVVTLLLVGVIELVWAVYLCRRSGSAERQLRHLDRMHRREVELDPSLGE